MGLLAATLLVIAGAILVPRAASVDPKLIGTWETHRGHSRFVFHPDGRFSYRTSGTFRGYKDIELKQMGFWGYKNDTIYLRYSSSEALRAGVPVPQVIEFLETKEHRVSQMQVRWRSENEFVSAVYKSSSYIRKAPDRS